MAGVSVRELSAVQSGDNHIVLLRTTEAGQTIVAHGTIAEIEEFCKAVESVVVDAVLNKHDTWEDYLKSKDGD